MIKKILIGILKFYKRNISPLIPSSCIFKPTCSEYAVEALKKHGVIKGIALALYRILRCNSFNKGGIDPVPDNYRKNVRWLI